MESRTTALPFPGECVRGQEDRAGSVMACECAAAGLALAAVSPGQATQRQLFSVACSSSKQHSRQAVGLRCRRRRRCFGSRAVLPLEKFDVNSWPSCRSPVPRLHWIVIPSVLSWLNHPSTFMSLCPRACRLYEHAALTAGGALQAAAALRSGAARLAVHLDGGRHHARKARASGFCFVNDAVRGL